MINSKNELKRRLKENKDNLVFETIMNKDFPQMVGTKRKANKVQTNGFSLLTEQEEKTVDSWTWYNKNIQIKNNIINYLDTNGNAMIQIKIIEIDQEMIKIKNVKIPNKVYYFAEGHLFNANDIEEIIEGFKYGGYTLEIELMNGIWTENYAIIISENIDNVKQFCNNVVLNSNNNHFAYIIEADVKEYADFLSKDDWEEILEDSLNYGLVQDITNIFIDDFENDILEKLDNLKYSVINKNKELVKNSLKIIDNKETRKKIQEIMKIINRNQQ